RERISDLSDWVPRRKPSGGSPVGRCPLLSDLSGVRNLEHRPTGRIRPILHSAGLLALPDRRTKVCSRYGAGHRSRCGYRRTDQTHAARSLSLLRAIAVTTAISPGLEAAFDGRGGCSDSIGGRADILLDPWGALSAVLGLCFFLNPDKPHN